jgi:hypothetical protein
MEHEDVSSSLEEPTVGSNYVSTEFIPNSVFFKSVSNVMLPSAPLLSNQFYPSAKSAILNITEV